MSPHFRLSREEAHAISDLRQSTIDLIDSAALFVAFPLGLIENAHIPVAID